MSRRDGIDIGSVINECKKYKDDINSLKKLSTPLEKQIKDYAVANKLDSIDSDLWKAKITVTPNLQFNELQAIEIIKSNIDNKILKDVIKTKEYIDEDALERLIYNGDFDGKLLACCTYEKEPTVRLTISKKKE